MTTLTETAAQVAALIPRFSWKIMDEDQRDELIENVVLPRYMATTADGTQLGPAWWAGALGAETAGTIRGRIRRLKARSEAQDERPIAAGPNATQKGSIRGAKAALRKHPELATALLDDPEVAEAIESAVHASRSRRLDHDLRPIERDRDAEVKRACNTIVGALDAAEKGLIVLDQSTYATMHWTQRAMAEAVAKEGDISELTQQTVEGAEAFLRGAS